MARQVYLHVSTVVGLEWGGSLKNVELKKKVACTLTNAVLLLVSE